MGRNSRQETDDMEYQGQNTNTQYGNLSEPARPVTTDSETMARDIKEGRLSGFVGHGTVLTGETNFQAMLRVDGVLQGTVSSDAGTLIVGSNGQVDANVAVASATINGTVNGDIVATEKLHLGRTAKVVGNVQTPKIIIEEGAVLEGSCSMLRAKEAQEKRDSEAKSGYAASQYSGYSQTASTASAEEEEESDDLLLSTDDDEEESAEAATL
ncbi:MAG TPA: polymer-forming cytoskeletal protein [Pyrinomonadaceae bacterium]|nr:polymer-forming cytoskeletal protein [Pyrinomonadaceae bacterium]